MPWRVRPVLQGPESRLQVTRQGIADARCGYVWSLTPITVRVRVALATAQVTAVLARLGCWQVSRLGRAEPGVLRGTLPGFRKPGARLPPEPP
jgi:hypothetical protein